LKTAFKILPETSLDKTYDLLIEIGRGGFSLTWYSLMPFKMEGLSIYQAQRNSDDFMYADDLNKLLASETLPPYRSCKICYNFKEGMPVPNTCYDAAAREAMLNDVYGFTTGAVYFTQPVANTEFSYIYRVPKAIDDVLKNRFAEATILHTNACLIASKKELELYCVIYNSYIKCILFKGNELQIIQSYDYQTPSDVAYHLLNICNLHNILPESITITLSGFVDMQSSLYEEIYRYFLNVQMEQLPQEVDITDEIKAYPTHFFSYLISLIQCAS